MVSTRSMLTGLKSMYESFFRRNSRSRLLTRISHPPPAADADPLPAASRTSPSRFDVVQAHTPTREVFDKMTKIFPSTGIWFRLCRVGYLSGISRLALVIPTPEQGFDVLVARILDEGRLKYLRMGRPTVW